VVLQNFIGWLFFFAGSSPSIIWTVAFEGFHKIKGSDKRTNTMELRMMWTNLFLIIWLLIFIPFFFLLNQPPLAEFWSNFGRATSCVFTGSGGEPEDDCLRAGWILLITIPIAALQAHSQIILSRDDSGLYATLALNIAPFLADLVFPFSIFMGPYVNPISYLDIIPAVVSFIGLLFYGYYEYKYSTDDEKQDRVDNNKILRWFAAPCKSSFDKNSEDTKLLLNND